MTDENTTNLQCYDCLRELPLSEFQDAPKNTNRFGKGSYCHRCDKKRRFKARWEKQSISKIQEELLKSMDKSDWLIELLNEKGVNLN
jgi:NMD protein affecting ribosome stability and mRNA decay